MVHQRQAGGSGRFPRSTSQMTKMTKRAFRGFGVGPICKKSGKDAEPGDLYQHRPCHCLGLEMLEDYLLLESRSSFSGYYVNVGWKLFVNMFDFWLFVAVEDWVFGWNFMFWRCFLWETQHSPSLVQQNLERDAATAAWKRPGSLIHSDQGSTSEGFSGCGSWFLGIAHHGMMITPIPSGNLTVCYWTYPI